MKNIEHLYRTDERFAELAQWYRASETDGDYLDAHAWLMGDSESERGKGDAMLQAIADEGATDTDPSTAADGDDRMAALQAERDGFEAALLALDVPEKLYDALDNAVYRLDRQRGAVAALSFLLPKYRDKRKRSLKAAEQARQLRVLLRDMEKCRKHRNDCGSCPHNVGCHDVLGSDRCELDLVARLKKAGVHTPPA